MDSKKVFYDKVDYYVKYRPKYPNEFIEYLVNSVGVSSESIVADVGAGTGIFTKALADMENMMRKSLKRIVQCHWNSLLGFLCQRHMLLLTQTKTFKYLSML